MGLILTVRYGCKKLRKKNIKLPKSLVSLALLSVSDLSSQTGYFFIFLFFYNNNTFMVILVVCAMITQKFRIYTRLKILIASTISCPALALGLDFGHCLTDVTLLDLF